MDFEPHDLALVVVSLAVLIGLGFYVYERINNLRPDKPNSFERRLLDSFLESSDGVAISNLDLNRCVAVNKAFTTLLNCSANDLVGLPVDRLTTDWWPDKASMMQATDDFLRQSFFKDIETYYKRLPNDTVPVIASGRSLKIAGYTYSVTTLRSNKAAIDARDALFQSEQRYLALLSFSPLGIFETNLKGELTYANQRWCEIFSLKQDEVRGRAWSECIFKDDKSLMTRASFVEQLSNATFHDESALEFRINNSDEPKWVSCVVRLVEDKDHKPSHLVGGVMDITDRKQRELSLKMFSYAVEHSGSAVHIRRKDGTIEYVNEQFCRFIGCKREDVIGTSGTKMQPWNQSISDQTELFEHIRLGKSWRGELNGKRLNGDIFWLLVSASPINDETDEITHYVIVEEDITELKRNQQEMEYLAYYDSLTGLTNRQLFRRTLEHTLLEMQRTAFQAALLYLDLDKFKNINDSLGHDAGDKLLIAIAQRLKDAVRQEDTVARLSGDEFCILLATIKSARDAAIIAQKIIDRIQRPITIDNHQISITASIGISVAPDDALSPATLMKNADFAMYRAKEKGKNTYQFYEPEMNEETEERRFIEIEMQRAIPNNEFYLVFQLQRNFHNNRYTAVEALIRWNHPQRGLIPPDSFIPIAEDNGFILNLGEWVLAEAFNSLRTIHQAGWMIRMGINLSARQLHDKSLLAYMRHLIQESKIDPSYIELEITESTIMYDVEGAIALLYGLKNMGVSLAIDDFGTGYSSLAYLKKLPIDTLKIDRSFVQDIPHNPDSMRIIDALIAMSHKLSLSVIAEGIESEEQFRFLKANGCDFGQGNMYCKPVNTTGLIEFLKVDKEERHRNRKTV